LPTNHRVLKLVFTYIIQVCFMYLVGVGRLNDIHCLSPILCDTVTTFIYIGQFSCYQGRMKWTRGPGQRHDREDP